MNRANPFVPGDGQPPPHLAGREAEQALLRKYLGRLQGRVPIPSNVILLGPRGNGKTVLLRWFKQALQATNKSDVAWLTPDEIPDLDKLANALAPPEPVQGGAAGHPGSVHRRGQDGLEPGRGAPRR